MKANITGKRGCSRSGQVSFEAVAPTEITRDQAKEAQADLGYNFIAYDFFGFECVKTTDGNYRATWACAASCD